MGLLMNFKTFYLSEMPHVKSQTMVGDNKYFSDRLKEFDEWLSKEKYEDRFSKNNIEYFLYKTPTGYIWLIKNKNKTIGYCGTRWLDKDFHNFMIMSTFYIDQKYRNQKIATNLYEHLIEKYGGIISDIELSKNDKYGSYYIYKNLIKKYFGYVHDKKKLTKITDIDDVSEYDRIAISKKELE
jgi:GNAT superfamily N-acetyltransferase